MDKFSIEAEYKVNKWKSIPFFYTNKEAAEKEIRENIPFTIASSKSNLGADLTKEMKELYNKDHRNLRRGMEERKAHVYEWAEIVYQNGNITQSSLRI